MKTLILLALSALAFGQTGTVSQSTTSAVVGTAGALVCTMTNTTPALPTGVHVACSNSGAAVLMMDAVIPVGPNGIVGSMTLTGNTITWSVTQPVAGPYAWQMAANGESKSGTF